MSTAPLPHGARVHPPGGVAAPSARLNVALYWLVLFVTSLDSSAMDFALPFIQRQSPQLAAGAGWAPVAYYACMAGCLAVLGFAADRLPGRTLALAGSLVALVSCALVGTAGDAATLACGRGLFGVGSAMLLAAIGAELARSVAPAARARAFGVAGSAIALALLVAPPLSSRIVGSTHWQWLVACSGLGIAALALGILRLPARAVPATAGAPPRWITSCATGALVAGVPFLAKAWLEQDTTVLLASSAWLALAAGALAGGWARERRGVRSPWLANGTVIGVNLLTFASFASAFILVFTLPWFAASGTAFSHLSLGVALTIFPLGLLVGSVVGARLGGGVGAVPALVAATVGAAVVSVGYGVLLRAGALGLDAVVALSLLSGFARGMAVTPTVLALLEATDESQRGAVSAMTNLVRTAGMAFGVTCASVILARAIGDATPGWLDATGWLQAGDLPHATALAFDASIVSSLLACACAAWLVLARGAARLPIVKGA